MAKTTKKRHAAPAPASASTTMDATNTTITTREEVADLDQDRLQFKKFVASVSNQVEDFGKNAITRDAFHGSAKPLVSPPSADLLFKHQPVLAHSLSSVGVALASNEEEELVEKDSFAKQGGEKSGGVSLMILPRDEEKDKKINSPDMATAVDCASNAGLKKKKKTKGDLPNQREKKLQPVTSSTAELALPTPGQESDDKRRRIRPRNQDTLLLTDDGGNKKQPTNATDPAILTGGSQKERSSSPITISGTEMSSTNKEKAGRKSVSILTSSLVKEADEEDWKLVSPQTIAGALLDEKEDKMHSSTNPRPAHAVALTPDQEANKLRQPTSPRVLNEATDDQLKIDKHLIKYDHNVAVNEKTPALHMVPPVPPPSLAPLISPSDAMSYTDEEDFSESQYYSDDEDDPVVVGVGIPEDYIAPKSPHMARFPSTGSSRSRVGFEESKEEVQELPPRNKTIEELNQEAIDGILAENIGINQSDAKGGKKSLPENVDPSSIIRRHSSRISCAKQELSYQRSAEFSMGGSAHTPVSPLFSPPSARVSNTSPAYGDRRAVGDLMEENKEELAAHAGIPAFALPGAYSMPGVGGPDRAESGAFSDLSDQGYDYFQDEELGPERTELPRESATTQQTMHTNTDEGIETGIDAELPRQQTGFIVDGQVVNPKDGLTEEERSLRKWKRWRLIIGAAILAIAAVVSAVVVAPRGDTTPPVVSTVDAWQPLGGTLAGPPVDDDLFFGSSISMAGNGKRVATGIPGIDKSNSDNDVGQVQIFDTDPTGTQWVLTGTLDFDAREGKAGRAVSLSTDGRRVAVGSPAWSNEIGLISIFEDDGNNQWQQIGGDIIGTESDGEKGSFGNTVALSADGAIVAAAAPFANTEFASEGGVVRVYKEVDSEWIQLGADIVSTRDRALLGISIALSVDGLRLATGATNFDTQVDVQVVGQVRVYDFDGSDWVQKGQTLDGSTEFEIFGNAVALNAAGNVMAVGANGSSGADDRVNSGKVRVFELVDAWWTQVGGDILGRKSENLGASVALSDDGILAVGSPTYRETGVETGQVKAYTLDSATGWTQIANAIDGASEGESFGISVAISSDGTVVGSGAPKASFDGGRVQEVGLVRIYQNKELLASTN